MAILEKTIRNKNFDKLLRKLEQEIPDSSWSADLEAGSDFKEGDARCSVPGAVAQCCLSDSYTSHRNSDACGLSARGFAPSFHKMTI